MALTAAALLLDKGAEVIACDIVTNDVDERAERKTLNLFELPEGNVYEQLGLPDVCLQPGGLFPTVHSRLLHVLNYLGLGGCNHHSYRLDHSNQEAIDRKNQLYSRWRISRGYWFSKRWLINHISRRC